MSRTRPLSRLLPVLLLTSLAAFTACGEDEQPLVCGSDEVLIGDRCRPDTRGPGTAPTDGSGEAPGSESTADVSSHAGSEDSTDTAPSGSGAPVTQEPPPSGSTSPTPPVSQPVDHGCGPGQPGTTISGVVRIPSGELPLPEVSVYIPRGDLRPIEVGATCEPCGTPLSGSPIVETTTDLRGRFELTGVSPGTDVPLVVEVGKWRREVTVPVVEACRNNAVDPDLTRLPRNQQEGSLPQFAVTTGGCDAMECLLRKIGISDSEFTPPEGGGRVHLYAGRGGTNRYANTLNAGARFTDAWTWWDRLDNLLPYDIIIHSCECSEQGRDKTSAATQAMRDFTNAGGRLFLTHYHYYWMKEGPSDFRSVAQWSNSTTALQNRDVGYIDYSFDKGMQLSEWMEFLGVGPSFGRFNITDIRGSIRSINEDIAQRWVWVEPSCDPIIATTFPWLCGDDSDEAIQYFSFNTPVLEEPQNQCGRVVFSDIHVAAGDSSDPDSPFPNGCTTSGLSEQETVLVFMLFDLARCISPDKF